MSRHQWTESESKDLLRRQEIPVAEGRLVSSAAAAVDAAGELGFPVVLKVSHPALGHKSDIGGVVLDADNAVTVEHEARRLLDLRPHSRVLVERQAPAGLDLIVGLRRDPVFGPVVMVGLGGIYAELMDDTALFVGAPTVSEAQDMLRRLKGSALLTGVRGSPPLALDAVADVLVRIGDMAMQRSDIVELDINPLRVWPDGVLALDALAVEEDRIEEPAGPRPDGGLSPFFAPHSVAVVGASRTATRAGNIIIRNCRALGYAGAVFPVNPGGGSIEGLPSYPTVRDCPEPPELAVVAVPYHQVATVMEDVAAAGTRHAIVVSGGFSDSDQSGKERERELLSFCRRHGIRLMGPNSIGTLDSRSGFTTSIGALPPVPPSGSSIIGQTGTLSTGYTLEEISMHGRGFARVACLGNKPDVDESDMLAQIGGHEETSVIGLYIESVAAGLRFMDAARKAAHHKPVFALKSGRTDVGARAAASHTGALAGEDRVYDAVFRQTGIQRVTTLPELFDALRTADMCPLPAGNRVGIVSLTGVGCVMAADACGEEGLVLAEVSDSTQMKLRALVPEWAPIRNPADIWSTIEQVGPARAFEQFCEVMIADDSVDILLVITVLLKEGSFDMGPVLAPLRAKHPGKPILGAWVGAREDLLDQFRRGMESQGMPVFEGPSRAIRMAGHLARRAAWERANQRRDI